MKTTKKATRWVRTALRDEVVKRKIKVRGQNVVVYYAPYEIPEAMRLLFDEEQKQITLEFRYVSEDEPRRTVTLSKTGSMKVGKITGRIYEVDLEFAADSPHFSKILAALNELLEAQAEKPKSSENLAFIREAMRSHQSELYFV